MITLTKKTRLLTPLAWVVITLLAVHSPIGLAATTVLKNATYFDNTRLTLQPNSSIVIVDDKIARVVAGEFRCEACQIIDVKGQYVIPGLMDLHQHTGLGGFAKLSADDKVKLLRKDLYRGITTVFNPNIDLTLLDTLNHTLAARLPLIRANVKALVAAGVTVGIGTDTDTPAMIFGSALGYELELHVEAGLSTAQVLDLATRGSAKVIGIDDKVGTIAAGQRADLLILADNPLISFKALNSIKQVIRNGVVYQRGDLALL